MGSRGKEKGKSRLIVGIGVLGAALVILLVIGLIWGRGGNREKTGGVSGGHDVSTMKSAEDGGTHEESDAPGSSRGIAGQPGETGVLLEELTRNIKTATVSVEVKKGSFNDNYAKLLKLSERYGGYVSDSKTSSSDGRITGGNVTMRIPADSFSKAIEDCRELGEVTSLSEQTEDVTDQYVDIDSRLRNLRAQEAVYLNLMAKARTIEESIAVQRELSALQGEIEQLTGQKNYLDNRIQLSTISVYVNEAGTEINGDEGWGFVQALGDAAHGVVNGLNVVIRFMGNALVYMVIALCGVLAVYVHVKRRRNGEPEDEEGRE
ncbi:MAG: DUF4349 domain-containing protein [Actinobacteria bacterium]|nr:DUF4349 domain-containing protein [Actinomycetota bacterium]